VWCPPESKEVFAWGENYCGQLGVDDTSIRVVPTQVKAFVGKHVVSITCGDWHTGAVLGAYHVFSLSLVRLGFVESIREPEFNLFSVATQTMAACSCGAQISLASLDSEIIISVTFPHKLQR